MQGKTIGDYHIIKALGEGTLGSLFLAEHRFIKKHYFLQILPEELTQEPSFLKRFEAHIGRVAALDHPHIVKVYNVSYFEGLYFLVMDCVSDEIITLADVMQEKEEPFCEKELLSILGQIADALDYAHDQGGEEPLVHGSLRLSNILVKREEHGLQVFLLDYGLFSIVGQSALIGRSFKSVAEGLSSVIIDKNCLEEHYQSCPIEARHLSKVAHSFVQSYAFLAPEQKKMQPSTIKSDAYAFGVLVYHLITALFPEGLFSMPSEGVNKYDFDFDHMIRSCLAFDPEKRVACLRPLLEGKAATLFTVEPRIEAALEREKPFIFEEGKRGASPLGAHAFSFKEGGAVTSEGAVATLSVTAKSVSEATPKELNPPKDENYAEALKAMLHRDPVVTHYQPQKRKSDNLDPIQSEMVVIEAGYFMRGSHAGARDEMPQHQIYLKSFAMDVHPITNEQFVRFLEYMGGEKDEQYNDLIRLKESRLHRSAGNLSIESGYAKHPVVGVTWYGAVAYAKWVNKRLPSEAEWEVAASGGLAAALYPTGETIEKSQANFFSSDTTLVKSYLPNGYGLYDMAGNVYEWCQDWYGYNYYESSEQEPMQPMGPLQGVYRVLRGGCWKSLKEDLRIAHRHRNNPGTVNGTYGFRCAADV